MVAVDKKYAYSPSNMLKFKGPPRRIFCATVGATNVRTGILIERIKKHNRSVKFLL